MTQSALRPRRHSTNTLTSPKTTTTTTTKTQVTIPPTEELYNDEAGRNPRCAEPQYPQDGQPVSVKLTPLKETKRTSIQYRKLLCVFDSRQPLFLQRLPTPHCSEYIYYALYPSAMGALPKYDVPEANALRALRYLTNSLRHNNKKVLLHATVGGARDDSASFVRMLRNYRDRTAFVNSLADSRSYNLFDGVNIHWDRPGDDCDNKATEDDFAPMIEKLRKLRLRVLLTVPPVLGLVRQFRLHGILQHLHYIVVTTHALVRKDILDCSGRGDFAAASFPPVRDYILSLGVAPNFADRLAYTISVGVHMLRMTLPITHPRLVDPASVAMASNGPLGTPEKISYETVCRLKRRSFDNDTECSWTLEKGADDFTELAVFAGPEEIAARMRRSYANNMGDATVVVWDPFLDDLDGRCSPPDQPLAWPLLSAVAQTGVR
ncbi:uncharacterized protein LOC144163332 isoform X1 [Haemaphysalis longicornis]